MICQSEQVENGFGQIAGVGRGAELVGDDAEFFAFLCQTDDGLDEVLATGAVEPAGADDEEAVTRGSLPVTCSSSRFLRNGIFVTASLSRPFGLYHFANSGQCSWYEFASEIIAQMKGRGKKLRVKRVVPIKTEDYPLPATRPAYSVFSLEKYRQATGAFPPDWCESLGNYLQERSASRITDH